MGDGTWQVEFDQPGEHQHAGMVGIETHRLLSGSPKTETWMQVPPEVLDGRRRTLRCRRHHFASPTLGAEQPRCVTTPAAGSGLGLLFGSAQVSPCGPYPSPGAGN